LNSILVTACLCCIVGLGTEAGDIDAGAFARCDAAAIELLSRVTQLHEPI
jgi:hypothetical protein